MAKSIRSVDRRTAPPATTTRPPYRFTVADYHRMGEIGLLSENSRCELIRGVVVEKPVIYPPHKKALRRLLAHVPPVFGPTFVIDSQGSITLADSEPEPDLTVAVGPEERYDRRHPGPRDPVLVVEVADSSLDSDRGEKLVLYAENRIPVYWIVNLQDRRIEVYTDPRGGRNPTYRTRADYAPGTAVPVVIGGRQLGAIAVTDVLP